MCRYPLYQVEKVDVVTIRVHYLVLVPLTFSISFSLSFLLAFDRTLVFTKSASDFKFLPMRFNSVIQSHELFNASCFGG